MSPYREQCPKCEEELNKRLRAEERVASLKVEIRELKKLDPNPWWRKAASLVFLFLITPVAFVSIMIFVRHNQDRQAPCRDTANIIDRNAIAEKCSPGAKLTVTQMPNGEALVVCRCEGSAAASSSVPAKEERP